MTDTVRDLVHAPVYDPVYDPVDDPVYDPVDDSTDEPIGYHVDDTQSKTPDEVSMEIEESKTKLRTAENITIPARSETEESLETKHPWCRFASLVYGVENVGTFEQYIISAIGEGHWKIACTLVVEAVESACAIDSKPCAWGNAARLANMVVEEAITESDAFDDIGRGKRNDFLSNTVIPLIAGISIKPRREFRAHSWKYMLIAAALYDEQQRGTNACEAIRRYLMIYSDHGQRIEESEIKELISISSKPGRLCRLSFVDRNIANDLISSFVSSRFSISEHCLVHKIRKKT